MSNTPAVGLKPSWSDAPPLARFLGLDLKGEWQWLRDDANSGSAWLYIEPRPIGADNG